jgi:hypothetical protein
MTTKEVARNEWAIFFDTFSKQHEGWLATLEVFADELGAQTEALDLPFEGISLDSEDKPESLVINMGTSNADHVSHLVKRPTHVWLQQTAAGADDSVEIEAEDEQKVLLRFRSPMRPELVDAMV